ncbi:MAG: hypothetical protein L0331_05880 [Chloroflexi bacterium]|nr:hypothetical protein [Chloroflexota bacterium]
MPTVNLKSDDNRDQELIYRHSLRGRVERRLYLWRIASRRKFWKRGLVAGGLVGLAALGLLAWQMGWWLW